MQFVQVKHKTLQLTSVRRKLTMSMRFPGTLPSAIVHAVPESSRELRTRSMGISRFGQSVLVFVFVGPTFVSSPSQAFDLTGAWTTQADTGQTQQAVCDKVFVKKGG